MNKTELVAKTAEVSGLTKKDAESAINAFVQAVEGAVKKGDRVQLIGFGTFELKKRAARVCKNPQTGAQIKVPATKVPAFKAGKAFKDAVK
ncbi:MAG: HU family DNA-binding protein [Clostridia bacterium]|nr:HU family DNA-binding protein [Clostridia bacterium]